MKINSPVWTISDLEGLPDNGNRYEIINGELLVTRAPHFEHQDICSAICAELRAWCKQTNLGKAVVTPGIVWSVTDAVIPDVVWASNQKLATCLDDSGHKREVGSVVAPYFKIGAEARHGDFNRRQRVLFMVVIFDIFLNSIRTNFSGSTVKIAMSPPTRKFKQMWKFLTQISTGSTLKIFSD